MYGKCTTCGSENTHRSRVRKGERTLSMIFIRPLRCYDCKARYWVPNIRAYLVAGVASSCGLLLAYFTYMLIIMPDQKIVRPQQLETWGGELMNNTATKLSHEAEFNLTPQQAVSVTVPKTTKITVETKTNEFYTDNRYFTVQLYYEKAQKGDTNAQYQLGLLYLNGKGTIQDFEEAAKWFELASEKNHALAQYQLGMMYKTGFGIDVNLEKSYMWLNLSAATGLEKAALARDKIMRSLNPEQLKQAQSASRKWLQNLSKERIDDN